MFRFAIFMIFAFSSAANLPKTKVVLINGLPGAGKTETRKALQRQSMRAFFPINIDLLFGQLPSDGKSALEDSDKYPQYHCFTKLELKEGKVNIITGHDYGKLTRALRALFRSLLEDRINIIFESLVREAENFNSYTGFIDPEKTDVYLIKVGVSPETLRERRLARDGFEAVSSDTEDIVFDLILRTDELTPEQAAAAIIEHIEANPPSAVFDAKNKIEFRY